MNNIMIRILVDSAADYSLKELKEKNIELSFSDEVITFISEKGLSKEFGAREIIRVINSDLKPILVDELLFGDLSNGGKCNLDMENNKFKLIK